MVEVPSDILHLGAKVTTPITYDLGVFTDGCVNTRTETATYAIPAFNVEHAGRHRIKEARGRRTRVFRIRVSR